MSDLTGHNPLGRFTGLAETYARHRPDYPTAALDAIIGTASLDAGAVVVDVGCGTGISSRQLALRGIPVIGLDPNEDMLGKARAEPPPPGYPRPVYLRRQAETTGLPDGIAAAVLAAQSFHWFAADAALREFHRLLRPGGWVFLLWNERDESDPFTAAYGSALRLGPEAAAVEGRRAVCGEALLRAPDFEAATRTVFAHVQELDEAGVLGRAFSASYAPREPAGIAACERVLREAFARFQQGGKVSLHYQTILYQARRPAYGPLTVTYTGVLLDGVSRRRLLERLGPSIPAHCVTIAHHLTLNLGPLDPALNPPDLLGRTVTLRVVSRAGNERVTAAGVETPLRTHSGRPHITLACDFAGGAEPRESLDLTDWQPLPEPFEVSGTVREVPRFGEQGASTP
jgi:SAM-dependent methyltransferase